MLIAWSVQLTTHNEEYHKELTVAQKRVKLLAYMGITNLVEVLSRRMTYSIFARSGCQAHSCDQISSHLLHTYQQHI